MPRATEPAGPHAGERAPTFQLPADNGDAVSLESLRGRTVVLYFYPKDDTSGCTAEACGIRDAWDEIQETGVVVLGVSPDGVDSHQRFRKKYRLPFPLLSDRDHAVAEAYGAWGKKSMYGRTFEGILRSTFIIDPQGAVHRVFRRVRPKGHAAEILAALRARGLTP